MNTEIAVTLISVSGPIVTALLTLLGIFVQKNYRCGKGERRDKDKENRQVVPGHIVQEQEPIVDTESITLTRSRPLPVTVDEEEDISCQILSTELGSFFGIVKVNESKCFSTKKKCRHCNKYFCEYHFKPNNTGDTGGHVCKP